MTPIEAAAAQLREDPTLHLMTGPEKALKRAWDLIGPSTWSGAGSLASECQVVYVGQERPVVLRSRTKADLRRERNRIAQVEAALIYLLRTEAAYRAATASGWVPDIRRDIEALWARNASSKNRRGTYAFIAWAADAEATALNTRHRVSVFPEPEIDAAHLIDHDSDLAERVAELEKALQEDQAYLRTVIRARDAAVAERDAMLAEIKKLRAQLTEMLS